MKLRMLVRCISLYKNESKFWKNILETFYCWYTKSGSAE